MMRRTEDIRPGDPSNMTYVRGCMFDREGNVMIEYDSLYPLVEAREQLTSSPSLGTANVARTSNA